eukprot:scaffold3761_cov372-Prasinococcus_capsulatus_cf.AAC.18
MYSTIGVCKLQASDTVQPCTLRLDGPQLLLCLLGRNVLQQFALAAMLLRRACFLGHLLRLQEFELALYPVDEDAGCVHMLKELVLEGCGQHARVHCFARSSDNCDHQGLQP